MKRISTLLVLLILFLAVQPLFSIVPKKSVCHPAYGENVNDLCLVGDQLWLATAGGLIRFDTTTGTYACYNKSNAGLPTNMVTFVAPYADGQLAFLTPKGIGIFRDTATVGIVVHSTDSIWKIAGVKTDMDFFNGKLYLGVLNRLLIYDQSNWKTLNVLPPYMSSLDLISDFEQGPDGKVFLARQRGVSEISGDSLLPVLTLARHISELAFTAEAMWMATPYGLYSKKDTLVKVLNKLNSALPDDNILRLKKGIDGKLWVLTRKGLTLYNPADARFITYKNDSLNFAAKPLMTVDLLGNVWLVGQRPGRIWKFDGHAWTHFNLNKGLKSNHVGDFVIHGKHVWIGGSDSTLTNYDGTGSCVYDSAGISVLKHKRPIFLKGKRVVFFADSDVVVDSYDTIRALIKTGYVNKMAKAAYDSVNVTYWAATSTGVEKIKDSVSTVLSVKALGAFADKVFGLYLEKNSDLLVSTFPLASSGKGGQLLRYSAGKLTILYTCPNTNQFVSAVVRDSTGALWMGILDRRIKGKTMGGGLICIKGNTTKVYTTTNSALPSNSISDISLDMNGNLWIACFDGGLTQLTKDGVWTNYTSENSALESDSLEQVAVDADNNIWASTQDGGITFLAGDPVSAKVVTALIPIETVNALEVYPMPCTAEVNLKFNVSVMNARVMVFNLSGQKLMDGSFTVPDGGVLTMPMSALSKGMYLMKVSTTGSTDCKRLVIQ